MTSPDPDAVWFALCEEQAKASDCTRRKVGAILVRGGMIVGRGYNSAPRYRTTDGCPRHDMDVPPYSDYSNCLAVHAEARCLLSVTPGTRVGSVMYVNIEPCFYCKILLEECGVQVKWPKNQEEKLPA